MISIRKLEKIFDSARGPVRAIGGIDLEVAQGEFMVLLGPSGCGKTTTLRCVAGLERPDGGSIEIDGALVNSGAGGSYVPPERRDIGMVFQSYAVWPHLNVYQNVVLPLTEGQRRLPRPEVRDRAREALRLVRLEGLEERPVTDLSGGQQQRVALARAVVTRPKVLLMDEPLSNLDARLRDQMRDELRRIAESVHVTSLYVTHDQAEALSLGDRVCVMNEGAILQLGTPRQVYSEPPNLFVARFVGEMNLLRATVVDAGRVESGLGTIDCTVPPGCAPGDAVTLGIRPEHIGIVAGAASAGPPDQVLRLPSDPSADGQPDRAASASRHGRVLHQTYLGDALHCQVQVGEIELTVKAVGNAEYARGETVAVSLPGQGWHVFPET